MFFWPWIYTLAAKLEEASKERMAYSSSQSSIWRLQFLSAVSRLQWGRPSSIKTHYTSTPATIYHKQRERMCARGLVQRAKILWQCFAWCLIQRIKEEGLVGISQQPGNERSFHSVSIQRERGGGQGEGERERERERKRGRERNSKRKRVKVE